MNAFNWITFFITVNFVNCAPEWIYPCRRIGLGPTTLLKICVLENVYILNDTLLYRVFFPPVNLEIVSGYIPVFSQAVASRLSDKTERLTVLSCGIERVFLRDNLQYVSLRGNLITEVLFDSKQVLNVTILHMGNNRLRDVSFVRDMKSLVILTLNQNFISDVRWDTFKQLKKLTFVDLGNNLIKTIHGTGNIILPSVRKIILAGNKITNLELQNITMHAMRELNISSNYLLSLNTFDLERTYPALESIDLNDNPWNCGRRQRIEDMMLIKGVISEKSTSPEQVHCHEDNLESISLTAPEEVDRLRYNFKQMQDIFHNHLSGHDAIRRLARVEERISYLDYDLNAISTATRRLKEKANHLFMRFNLRTSRNLNMHS